MAIILHEDGGITITGASINDVARPLALRSALKLEIRTGLQLGRGVTTMQRVNQIYGTGFRRKEKALEFMETICDAIKTAQNVSR